MSILYTQNLALTKYMEQNVLIAKLNHQTHTQRNINVI